MSAITTIPDRDPGYVHHVLLYGAMEKAGIRYVQIPFSLGYLLRHAPEERYHYVERIYGTFLRSVRLPMAVDGSKVTATFKNGVVVVTLPKTPAAKGTMIPVKAE